MPHVSNWPLFGLTTEEMFVKDEQFVHKSKLHGQGHVNRVIWWAMQLCKAYGQMERWGPAVWAAAYIHDLSRKHDGLCYEHGMWAVQEQFPRYLPLFRKAGVRGKDHTAIMAAVIAHSRPDELPSFVCQCLKDADGMDRVRLGDLDIGYLRLKERSVPYAEQYAQELFEQTPNGTGFETISAGLRVCFKHYGLCEEFQEANWERRQQLGGHAPVFDEAGSVAKYRCDKHKALRKKFEEFYDGKRLGGLERMFSLIELPVTSDQLVAVRFCRNQTTNPFWEIYYSAERGKSWHWEYSDCPQDSRAYNDIRLFGNICRETVYFAVASSRWWRRNLSRLMQMYGNAVIQICRPINFFNEDNTDSTFTVGDSQTAAFPFQCARTSRKLTLQQIYLGHLDQRCVAYCRSRFGREWREGYQRMIDGPRIDSDLANYLAPPFIEVQCHKAEEVTPSSIHNVNSNERQILSSIEQAEGSIT